MKKQIFIAANPRAVAFDNDFDTDSRAYVPEMWAQESLMVLEENMVTSGLVHRSFENEIASFGDVVNTRRPGKFTAKRKLASDEITLQDADAERVQVKLNQHLHTSFIIKDEEMSKSFKDLVAEFLTPAIRSLASEVDRIVLGQTYQFLGNTVGQLGVSPTKATIIAANTLMNQNLVPLGAGQRNFILTPSAEGALLDIGDFTKVNEAGDGGQALQNAMLGRKFGFDFYMDQNASSIASTQTTGTRTINLGAGYAAGTKTFVCDSGGSTLVAGQWITIAGDMTPLLVSTATDTAIVTVNATKNAVEDGAVITIYPVGAINLDDYTDSYAAGYVKTLSVDGFTDAPLLGQLVSNGGYNYSVIGSPTTTAIDLNRETQNILADGAVMALGPAGDYSLGMHPNAMSLVVRPLATVGSEYGARQAVVNYNGLSMRISMQYSAIKQGMIVTADMLAGVKVLDTALGVVMLG